MNKISEIELALSAIKIPEPEKLDITPTLTEIMNTKEEVIKAIENKEVTQIPDLRPIVENNSKENANLEKAFREALALLLDGRKDRDGKLLDFMKQTGERFDVSDKVRALLNGDMKPFEKQEKTQKKKRLFLNT